MRSRSKVYVSIAQFLNKDGLYELAEAFAQKCIDLCTVELYHRFSDGFDEKMIDLDKVQRMRKCAAVFMLACFNLGYSACQQGNISKSYEAYSLAEFVIAKCYREQDQIYKVTDKAKRMANVMLLPHIWQVAEFKRILFDTFETGGAEFLKGRDDVMISHKYTAIPTKKLVQRLMESYQGKIEMLNIIKQDKMKEYQHFGNDQADFNLFVQNQRQMEEHQEAHQEKPQEVQIFLRNQRVSFLEDVDGASKKYGDLTNTKVNQHTITEDNSTNKKRLEFTDLMGNSQTYSDATSQQMNPGELLLGNRRLMVSSRPLTSMKLGKSKSSGQLLRRIPDNQGSVENFYAEPTQQRPLTANIGYVRSASNMLENFRVVRGRAQVRSAKGRVQFPVRQVQDLESMATQKIGSEQDTQFKSKLASMKYFRSTVQIKEDEQKKKQELGEAHGARFLKLKYKKTKQEIEDDRKLVIVNEANQDPYKPSGLLIIDSEEVADEEKIKKKNQNSIGKEADLGAQIRPKSQEQQVKKHSENELIDGKTLKTLKPRKKDFEIKELNPQPLEIFVNPFEQKRALVTVDKYFNLAIKDNLEIKKQEENFEKAKANFIHRVHCDDYDKKESNFCRKMILHKGVSTKKIHQEPPFKYSDIVLDHHFIRAVTSYENSEKNMLSFGVNLMSKFIIKHGLMIMNKNRKLKLVDIMLRHPDVFRLNNINLHRKKLEKDPEYQQKEVQIQEYFINRRSQIEGKIIQKRTKQKILDTIDSLKHQMEEADEIKKQLEENKLVKPQITKE